MLWGVVKVGRRCYHSIKYWKEGRIAHLLLNRPERLNAIDHHMPFEIQKAIKRANFDEDIHAILLYGAGGAFCSGYDLKTFAEEEEPTTTPNKKVEEDEEEEIPRYTNQSMPWDPCLDYQFMWSATQAYMEIFRSNKPVVGKIERVAIGGGSDIALACDVTFIESSAKIGYPPSTIWGCPTTAFWYYRLGAEKAKRILFTGEVLSGEKAVEIGLIGDAAASSSELDAKVSSFMERLSRVPKNQLWYSKSVVNAALEQAGLTSSQRLATLFDGMSRHSPEGLEFARRCAEIGFKGAVRERDSGQETLWSHLSPKTNK